MQASAAQRLSHPHLAHGRAERLEALDGIADEIRELVDRLAQLHQCLRSSLVKTFHPRGNRGSAHEKRIGSPLKRPAACTAQLKDGHPLGGRITRPPLGSDPRHAAILDANLFGPKGKFLQQSVVLGLQLQPSVRAAHGPAARVHRGVLGQRDDVQHRRAHMSRKGLR